MRFPAPTRLAAICLVTSGACSLGSLDDLKGGRPPLDAGTDSPLSDSGSGGSDAASDVASCDATLATDPENCGSCGTKCDAGDICVGGSCVPCNSSTTDCDGDSWLAADGDCCDKPGACGAEPAMINPGAVELVGNGIDDNCNGLLDLFDLEDTVSCDAGLYSNTTVAANYARAMGICRGTESSPATPQERTWGLISATLELADGTPLVDTRARSIRQAFGAISPKTTEGSSVAVLSTGIASDATQTTPGPNGGAPTGFNVSTIHTPASLVDLATCTDPNCISDWFVAENLPLKKASELPTAPACPPSSFAAPNEVHDSVMLDLVLRAPTNVKAFSFNTYFFSAEYPEFVCSDFNDQFIALVDTPTGTPSPIPNPPDKNLLTYTNAGKKWPVGINVAAGTSLFAVCESETANPTCWNAAVDGNSCSLGPIQLTGTGFEANSSGCLLGGGTHWLTVGGNVIPGQILHLRLAIWDVGDASFDSTALIDGFQWLTAPIEPGTT